MDVVWTPRSLKQLTRLKDEKAKRRIVEAVRTLADFPSVAGIRPLRNHRHGFRLRVGNYRVLFDVIDDAHIISIEEVRKRNERTY